MSDHRLSAPGFWMNEQTGRLRPAIEAYLNNRPMTPEQITAMRMYLRQWIEAPGWIVDAELIWLRQSIDTMHSRKAIREWLDRAEGLGIDPL